ncbi:sensor histidine kinase [Papillibacter cinnamivorans]|uniref:histidine kinase n=1 Tax=Papillibacter cinnamivorans DSM 12816 TaxID=1122930 RepID=A0A1W1ZJL7_9FIRM|nr:HAMP domain-containing sensor histidine kinase [Papillibacter cinnamivorans]SMC48231.1 Signal transduction histidine kinase [Papillibacter cinnamivorans DSM 12816]
MTLLKGIKRRWMFNSVSAMLLIVLIGVSAFSMALSSYYYSSVRTGLEAKAKTASEFFSNYMLKSYSEYYQTAYSFTQKFDEKDRLELQFINAAGNIEISTYGLTAGTSPRTPEIEEAIRTGEISSWTGNDPLTGERVMAVSSPMVFSGTVVGVMRYVTALKVVDLQILKGMALALGVGALILVLVIVSNLYFIRSIVEPVAEITATTKRIASGSYGVQIEKKHEDEIGELIDTINDMSNKISYTEKVKREFISSISHELRTPLTAINGWGETLMHENNMDPEDLKKGVGIILKESRRLTTMVEELLEFNKMEDGRFTLRIEPVDLQAEFEDAIYTYREFFRQEGIELEYHEEEEEIPPISGDPERLRQVFCNILDNAAKHGGSGKKITAWVQRDGNFAEVKIRDYGPGVLPEELPHLKYMFYKGSSKARGSGIGLAVCEEIVTRHNGQLILENAPPPGGLLVTIRLPLGGT